MAASSLPYRPDFAASAANLNSGHVRDHEQLAALVGRGEHRVGVLGFEGDGLLDEDVFARFEGFDDGIAVEVVRVAHVHQVHVGVGEEFVERRVGVDSGEVDLFAVRSEVAPDAGPVAGTLLGVSATDRGELSVL